MGAYCYYDSHRRRFIAMLLFHGRFDVSRFLSSADAGVPEECELRLKLETRGREGEATLGRKCDRPAVC